MVLAVTSKASTASCIPLMILVSCLSTDLTPAAVSTDLEAFKTFLLAERGREFYVEGWRRDDLLRFDDYIASALRRGKTSASEKNKLMPIPQRVINESNGIIEQNPGY